MYTEEEARKRWCPFARQPMYYRDGNGSPIVKADFPTPGINRLLNKDNSIVGPTGCRCIASECMAWRWDEEKSDNMNADWSAREPMQRTPDEHEKVHGPCPDKGGYCGLAGKP